MASPEHVTLLQQGVGAWNQWRSENPTSGADLRGADLRAAHLSEADLRGARLSEANLRGADLASANLEKAQLDQAILSGAFMAAAGLKDASLTEADLRGAMLAEADLTRANLRGAHLGGANLGGSVLRDADCESANLAKADLTGADLSGVNLRSADLTFATLARTRLQGADLSGCRVFGVSAWALDLTETAQADLIITDVSEPVITVDNLGAAQFIYLLLNNPNIRAALDTLSRKTVLVLGRFTSERKTVLDALRQQLRTGGYVPILLDFERPSSRSFSETLSTLAHLVRFVIADITDAKAIPQELAIITSSLSSVPVQPLLMESQRPYAMFQDLKRYPWVLETFEYRDLDHLAASLAEKVIEPAEAKARELQASRLGG